MFQIIKGIFTSRILRLLFRLITSLASAVLVVSGYLFFLSVNERNRDDDNIESSEDAEDDNIDDDTDK